MSNPAVKYNPDKLDEDDSIVIAVQEPAPRNKKPIPYKWITSGILLLCAIAALAAWIVHEQRYASSDIALVRGHIAELGARLDGVVERVLVDTGDQVKAGQPLVTFEQNHLHARVAQADARLITLERQLDAQAARIDYERKRLGERNNQGDANLAAMAAEVRAAKIRSDDNRSIYITRRALLKNQGAISAEEVRDTRADWQEAEAMFKARQSDYNALAAAENRARLANAELVIQEQELGILSGQIEQARAARARVQADLASSTIFAPESGVIVSRIVQPGASIEAGLPTVSMWLDKKLWIEAWLDEKDIIDVNIGADAIVTLHAIQGEEFWGKVTAIRPVSDVEQPQTEMLQPRFTRMRAAPVMAVLVTLDNPPQHLTQLLRPGLSAEVAIVRNSGSD